MGNADLVPWCHECDRFYNPNSLRADGTCPTGDHAVAEPAKAITDAPDAPDSVAPWHFKVLIAVTAVYLGYRLLQGLSWVGQHL